MAHKLSPLMSSYQNYKLINEKKTVNGTECRNLAERLLDLKKKIKLR